MESIWELIFFLCLSEQNSSFVLSARKMCSDHYLINVYLLLLMEKTSLDFAVR